jgi:hypothetical protein
MIHGLKKYYYSCVSMSFSETSSAQLEADYHQRVVMKFSLKDTLSGDFVKAHQVHN